MKKFVLTGFLSLFIFISFAQKEEENGKIYIKHPYIDEINKSMKAYTGDFSKLVKVK